MNFMTKTNKKGLTLYKFFTEELYKIIVDDRFFTENLYKINRSFTDDNNTRKIKITTLEALFSDNLSLVFTYTNKYFIAFYKFDTNEHGSSRSLYEREEDIITAEITKVEKDGKTFFEFAKTTLKKILEKDFYYLDDIDRIQLFNSLENPIDKSIFS